MKNPNRIKYILPEKNVDTIKSIRLIQLVYIYIYIQHEKTKYGALPIGATTNNLMNNAVKLHEIQ